MTTSKKKKMKKIKSKQKYMNSVNFLKYERSWNEIVTKKHRTLTHEEKALIKYEESINPNLKIFCECCQDDLISDIIHRTFIACGRCYCCVGDVPDPIFDDDEWFESCYVETGRFHTYKKDYHYTTR
jgi:hypothetical protein